VPSLEVTAEKTVLLGVVTQPDRPAGRGQRLQQSDVKRAAIALALPIFEPASLKSFAAERAGEAYDLFIVASYGRILPVALLNVPRLGALNVHPSLLPRYRGATPIQAALRNGDSATGVSIMLMDSGMDTGPIVVQEPVAISPQENAGELHDRLAQIGARLLSHAIDLAAENNLAPYPQTGDASVTRPISRDDLLIDWSWPAAQIVNTIRAFSPVPAARGEISGLAVKLVCADAVNDEINVSPGTAIDARGDLIVVCGDGAVRVDELIPPNRGKMTGRQFNQWLKARQK